MSVVIPVISHYLADLTNYQYRPDHSKNKSGISHDPIIPIDSITRHFSVDEGRRYFFSTASRTSSRSAKKPSGVGSDSMSGLIVVAPSFVILNSFVEYCTTHLELGRLN